MPTYSYKCTECDTAFDIQQAFSDSSLTECPKCGGKLRKVFSAIGVAFNGSGFYRNDSREKTRSGAGAGSSSSSSSSTKSDSSSSSADSSPTPAKSADSKPATAAQSSPTASSSPAAG